jgi:(p)ppGpp synthase/HD superfamily hydrolase
MRPVVLHATQFAIRAHGEQKRKYTGDPYILHTLEVAEIVARWGMSDDVIAAAILHDTIEDTTTSYETLLVAFGPRVATFVREMTDIYADPRLGNRTYRKERELARLADVSYEAQTIKLADGISNTRDITAHDPVFARVYLREKDALLGVLTKPDELPRTEARAALDLAEKEIGL